MLFNSINSWLTNCAIRVVSGVITEPPGNAANAPSKFSFVDVSIPPTAISEDPTTLVVKLYSPF